MNTSEHMPNNMQFSSVYIHVSSLSQCVIYLFWWNVQRPGMVHTKPAYPNTYQVVPCWCIRVYRRCSAKRDHKPKPMDGYKPILVFLLAWTPRSTVLGWTKSLTPRSLSVCSLSIPHWPLYKYSSISRYTDMRIRPLRPYRQSHCHCHCMPRPANSFLLVSHYQRKSPLIGWPCLAGASSYISSQAI